MIYRSMNIAELINHPERLDRETLYALRSHIALYPYHQNARLLMLQNLYLLHDPTFDQELRRAAIYLTDRRNLFNLVEATHYQLKPVSSATETETRNIGTQHAALEEDRTISLIDNFLNSIPDEGQQETDREPRRRPTATDAAVDYVAYLLNAEAEPQPGQQTPQMKGQALIDNFIYNEGGSFTLKEEPEYTPEQETDRDESEETDNEEEYFTETLAKIYIKQGKYSQALKIIQRLNLIYPNKTRTFASQIRFLEKLIINERSKNK